MGRAIELMAQRRMFSLKIVDTDMFLDLPTSAQNLYFHLGMRADDDGFVSSPRKIMKITAASDDDYKLLVAKQFVIPFESGIIVIRNWRENNYIQKDRYTPTIHKKEAQQLECKDNVYKLDTQVRLGKDRLGYISAPKRRAVKKSSFKGSEPDDPSEGVELQTDPDYEPGAKVLASGTWNPSTGKTAFDENTPQKPQNDPWELEDDLTRWEDRKAPNYARSRDVCATYVRGRDLKLRSRGQLHHLKKRYHKTFEALGEYSNDEVWEALNKCKEKWDFKGLEWGPDAVYKMLTR